MLNPKDLTLTQWGGGHKFQKFSDRFLMSLVLIDMKKPNETTLKKLVTPLQKWLHFKLSRFF